ncbi:MAG: mechanosensitive ion channel [bacterium]|nr:mechanosensitive ion channel [bacterium]
MNLMERLYELMESPLLKIPGVSLSLIALIKAALILLAASVFSRLLIRFLKKSVFSKSRIGAGPQASIARVIHYLIMILGTIIALEALGINLTALAAVSAVVMVGVGFGLQNITSNFISGLILLFERPIQVDDFVEVSGVLGRVRAINARSTTVDTQDNVSIIVPNSQFISEQVTNWSYRDSRTRLHVRVGVSYSADVELVRNTLIQVGAAHPDVLEDPKPSVQFYEFGDSALLFDLLVWINNPPRQYFIRSDLNFAIVAAFRKNRIEIPFPQRDLHIRSSIPFQTSTVQPSVE